MALRTATNPNAPVGRAHPDAPRRASGLIVLDRLDEVRLVSAEQRTLHLVPTDPQHADRWKVDDFHLVRARETRDVSELTRDERLAPPKLPRVQIRTVALVTLGELTAADAPRLIGRKHAKLVDVARWWLDRHDVAWRDRPEEERDRLDSMVVMAEWKRWAPWQVWRLTWTLDPRHETRLLGRDGQESYVRSTALALAPGQRGEHDPGEAVDSDTQDGYTAEAQAHIEECTRDAARQDQLAYSVARGLRAQSRSARRAAHHLATRDAALAAADRDNGR